MWTEIAFDAFVFRGKTTFSNFSCVVWDRALGVFLLIFIFSFQAHLNPKFCLLKRIHLLFEPFWGKNWNLVEFSIFYALSKSRSKCCATNLVPLGEKPSERDGCAIDRESGVTFADNVYPELKKQKSCMASID